MFQRIGDMSVHGSLTGRKHMDEAWGAGVGSGRLVRVRHWGEERLKGRVFERILVTS